MLDHGHPFKSVYLAGKQERRTCHRKGKTPAAPDWAQPKHMNQFHFHCNFQMEPKVFQNISQEFEANILIWYQLLDRLLLPFFSAGERRKLFKCSFRDGILAFYCFPHMINLFWNLATVKCQKWSEAKKHDCLGAVLFRLLLLASLQYSIKCYAKLLFIFLWIVISQRF